MRRRLAWRPNANALRDQRRTVTTAAVVVIAMSLPPLGIGRWLAPADDMASRLVREGVFWLIALALICWVLGVERRPLASIGLRRPGASSVVLGVTVGILLTGLYILIATLLIPALHLKGDGGAMRGLLATPLWFRLMLVARAAVTEEILYRGYPIERIEALTGSRIAAGAVSVVGFSLAHLNYWGPVQLLFVAPAAVILVALYVWRRDLVCNMTAHFVADAMGFLATP